RRKIEVGEGGEALALQVVQQQVSSQATPRSLDERITSALADAASPLPFADLRSQCRVRNATLYERLATLITDGRIVKDGEGYRLASLGASGTARSERPTARTRGLPPPA